MYQISKDCPLTYASKILGRKWSIIVIYYLLDGEKKFSDLEKLIDGISPKVLASTLDFLREYGIVQRKVYDSKPVTVKYKLTDKGRDLYRAISALIEWSDRWGDNIKSE